MAAPSLRLNNGCEMPIIGLGSWDTGKGGIGKAVEFAIDCGYRNFDTAWLNRNESEIGKAICKKIKEKKITREDVFITNKLWNTFHDPGDVRPILLQTLKKMQIDYLDSYLMCWPMGYMNPNDDDVSFPTDDDNKIAYSDFDYVTTWKAMEALQKEGLVRSIGVSNFNEFQINRILKECDIPPAVNQIELHPYLTDHSLVDFCKEKGIVVTAYSPLGSPSRPMAKPEEPILLEDPKLKEIAAKLNKTVAQIVLRYLIQRGVVVIPKSATPSRIEENFKIFNFELTNDDMEAINGLNKDFRMIFFEHDFLHKYYPFRKNYTEM